MTDTNRSEDWRVLCELASKEKDSEKLMDLIVKIIQTLAEPSGPPLARPRPGLNRSWCRVESLDVSTNIVRRLGGWFNLNYPDCRWLQIGEIAPSRFGRFSEPLLLDQLANP